MTTADPHAASLLEKLYLGSNVIGSTLVGLANAVAPFDVMSTRIERSGGGSIQLLFDATVKAAESAESAAKTAALTTAAPSAPASSPYAAAVGGTLPTSTSPQALAQERLAAARENVDTLAALVASTLFQVQYAIAGDALVSYLAYHGLRTGVPAERRLVQRCLGVVKATQYAVYLMHESAMGGLSVFNIAGLVVSMAAAWVWGWRAVPAIASAAKGDKVKTETANKSDTPY
ncbi:hypothetical protein BC830DRAFT_1198510 [Chytriomyces sp. MP71]|nr:hypothetical protein BC830DRAFT_1198510 [Chytriomyces sp. MP71]